MKRSKVFLGITTCLLAIAGIAAGKAAKGPSVAASYFTNGPASTCVPFTQAVSGTIVKEAPSMHMLRTGGRIGRILYTAGNFCTHVLYTALE